MDNKGPLTGNMLRSESNTVIAFSGGKDSTAMAIRMAELGEAATMLFTPAQNEPRELFDHVEEVGRLTGYEIATLKAPTLLELIREFKALPNHRQRWCTRMIKILPAKAYLKSLPIKATLCVGLRADEPERDGMYGDHCNYRYPLREWGWDVRQVVAYLESQNVTVPKRTNCKFCYGQRIGEWYELWRDHKDDWAFGEQLEAETGYTFRSPSRDTWLAAMKDLRAEFERGREPRKSKCAEPEACRVCTL